MRRSRPAWFPGSARRPRRSCRGWESAPWPQLRAHDDAALQGAFGPRLGRWLQARARFEDETPLSVVREAKSQSTETTFDIDVADRAEMAASLASLAEELCRRLRVARPARAARSGSRSGSTTGPTSRRSHTVEAPTNDPAVVRRTALDLLHAYSPPRPVRLLGVRVAGFDEASGPPRTMPPEAQLQLGLQFLATADLAAAEQDADAREAESLPGRLGQVEVAAGDVRARGR